GEEGGGALTGRGRSGTRPEIRERRACRKLCGLNVRKSPENIVEDYDGGGPGVAAGERRAAAHRCRSGRRHLAHGAGSATRMIHLPGSVRVYLCLTACDMRKSFDGLHALVREHLEVDAFAGHLFVFASRRKDRVKILYWDRDGFAVWSKRLEEGTYAVPFGDSAEERRREITAQELGALLSGIDLNQATRRRRYRRFV